MIVNQKLARHAWERHDPVGRTLVLDYQGGTYPYEVVGVVRDVRFDGPRSEPVPEIFIPHAQNPYLVMNVIARTTLDPLAVAQTARAAALRVDPDQPVHSVTTMERLLGEAVQIDRFAMLLITLFAVAGLITAAGGVYALLAYTVAQRRREIALRMALGASPQRVARSIVVESLVLAAAGGAIGLVGAAAGSRFARTLLFGVAPQDPITLVTAVLVLLVVVMAASWLPARRASLIDPSRAMRVRGGRSDGTGMVSSFILRVGLGSLGTRRRGGGCDDRGTAIGGESIGGERGLSRAGSCAGAGGGRCLAPEPRARAGAGRASTGARPCRGRLGLRRLGDVPRCRLARRRPANAIPLSPTAPGRRSLQRRCWDRSTW